MRVKVEAASCLETLYPVNLRSIPRPQQPFFPLFRFLRKVIKLRKSGVPLPRTPWLDDESLCTHCGTCVRHCPVGAIVKGDEVHTDAEKCIKCCACVKSCTQQARVYDTPFAVLLSQEQSCNKGCKKARIIDIARMYTFVIQECTPLWCKVVHSCYTKVYILLSADY